MGINVHSFAAVPKGRPKAAIRFSLMLALTVLLSCCGGAFAATVQMTFAGVNGAAAFGYYIGTYYGTMNDAPVDLFCVDFANDVWIGEQWKANLSSINTGADLSQTRYGDSPGALTLYQEAAWLTEQYATQPEARYADIQATIWDLFNPRISPQPASAYWLKQAQINYTSENYSDFRVVTNLGPVERTGQVQEFLTHVDPVSTPEPAPLVLVGISLGAVSWCRKRFRRKGRLP